jgi:hypothetical protein
MSNENKFHNFADVVKQVVRANRSRKPTVNIDNMFINELDRDYYFDALRGKKTSNTKQYPLKNLSNTNLFVNRQFPKKDDGKVEASKFSTMKQLIMVETFLTKDVTGTDGLTSGTTKNTTKDISPTNIDTASHNRLALLDDVDDFIDYKNDDVNTTQRLISNDISTTDIESQNKVFQKARIKRMNTHPSLRYLKSIVYMESVPPDQVMIMNLTNQLKIYEFITSLFTFISNWFYNLGILSSIVYFETGILYNDNLDENVSDSNESLLTIKYLVVSIINICSLLYCKYIN